MSRPLRILLSYWYFRTANLESLIARFFPGIELDIFADSGAFSAMTQGSKIEVGEYADWIHRYKHLFSVYANLDVIRDAEETWANQMKMEDRGLAPLPVFHVAESWDWLERYLDRYSYIGLGVAGSDEPAYWPWLLRCFKLAAGRATYHGFGITSVKTMASLPWASLDSSSWVQGFRFGSIPLWDDEYGRFRKVQQGDRSSIYGLARLIRSYGFEPETFCVPKAQAKTIRPQICALSALSYMRLEDWLNRRRAGTKVYLSDDSMTEGRGGRQTADALAGGVAAYLSDGYAGRSAKDVGTGQAVEGGRRIYLADTGGGGNHRDAGQGLKLFLAESNPRHPDLGRANGY